MTNEEYLKFQFDEPMVNHPQNVKIKVISENGQTNWINISEKQANAVLKALINNLES